MAKIKDIGVKTLKDNPTAKKVFVTSDGIPFLTENAANLHATSNASKKTLIVSVFNRAETKQSTPETTGDKKLSAPQKAKLRKEAIVKLETVEAIDKALETETANSVIKAGKARKEELMLLAKSGTNSPETRGNEIAPKNNNTDVDPVDYTQIATQEELVQFATDNEIDLKEATELEAIRAQVIAYLADPNKVIVPYKTKQ